MFIHIGRVSVETKYCPYTQTNDAVLREKVFYKDCPMGRRYCPINPGGWLELGAPGNANCPFGEPPHNVTTCSC